MNDLKKMMAEVRDEFDLFTAAAVLFRDCKSNGDQMRAGVMREEIRRRSMNVARLMCGISQHIERCGGGVEVCVDRAIEVGSAAG